MDTTSFAEIFSGAIEYCKNAFNLVTDIFDCFPTGVQNLLFAVFVVIVGSAVISAIFKILS